MRIDQTTVPLVPRTTANCLDLGIKFFAGHSRHIVDIWLSVALPAGVLAYLLSVRLDMDFRLTLLVLYFATMPLGVLLIAGTSRALFGDNFVPTRSQAGQAAALGRLLGHIVDGVAALLFGALVLDHICNVLAIELIPSEEVHLAIVGFLLMTLSLRLVFIVIRYSRFCPGMWRVLIYGLVRRLAIGIGPGLMLFPNNLPLGIVGFLACVFGIFLLLRSGFYPEAVFLSPIDRQLRSRKTKELLKKEMSELFFRGCWIFAFCMLASVVLFLAVDLGSELLFGYPIMFGRLRDILPDSSSSSFIEAGFDTVVLVAKFAASDPKALAVMTTVVLVAYPIGRLAWFFCYIDLRVRRDLWDLELQFQQEAQRLERRRE